VFLPSLTQDLRSGMSVVWSERHAEQLAKLAKKIGQIGLGPAKYADLGALLGAKPVGEDTQGDRLSHAWHACHQREAAVTDELLDPPAEPFDLLGDVKSFSRHLGGKR
jgi:hypothetical protein